jgi:hypothetical protein
VSSQVRGERISLWAVPEHNDKCIGDAPDNARRAAKTVPEASRTNPPRVSQNEKHGNILIYTWEYFS